MASKGLDKRRGTWYVSWYVNGKRYRKAVGRNKQMAEQIRKKIEAQVELGKLSTLTGEPLDIVPREYFDAFLEYLIQHYPPRTAQRYAEIIGHFRQYIAERRIGKLHHIKPHHIAEYESRRAKVVTAKTIRNEYSVLRLFFARAEQIGYVKESPIKTKPPKAERPKEARYLTKEEIHRLLAVSEPYHRVIWTTLILTGMRSGELTNLEWQDLNFKQHKITIRNRSDWGHKDRESRSIPLAPELANLLESLPHRSDRLVFATSTGGQLDHLYRRFQRYASKAGIEEASPHTLRHTFASHLAKNNVSPAVIMKLMGHSDIRMTMRYAHLAPSDLGWAIDRLSSALKL